MAMTGQAMCSRRLQLQMQQEMSDGEWLSDDNDETIRSSVE